MWEKTQRLPFREMSDLNRKSAPPPTRNRKKGLSPSQCLIWKRTSLRAISFLLAGSLSL